LKNHLEEEFGLQITDIILCQKGSVPKTTSGKIRRFEAKRMFQENEFHSLAKLEDSRIAKSFTELLEHFGVLDMKMTLLENGIDSLKLSKLIEESRNQFDIIITFPLAMSVPCKDLENASKKLQTPQPMPRIPECDVKDKTMKYYVIIQLIGVFFVILVVVASVIPSAYLYQCKPFNCELIIL
jgi:hypothetical protein